MEMHQVRYFLAVARILNFTRAAEECHVAQPSLTRAIKQLEDEFGGELFRRERNLTHLSDLGHRMLPMMQQCYDSALSAKTLAHSMKSGAVAPLSIALSVAVNIVILVSFLTELVRAFPGLELRFYRGNSADVVEFLKKGEVEVAIAGPLGALWDRLDGWPIYTEPYVLAIGKEHRLAKQNKPVAAQELKTEHLLCRTYCEHVNEIQDYIDKTGGMPMAQHKVGSEHDLVALIESNLGIGIVPRSSAQPSNVACLGLEGLDVTRTVSVYGVAGRQRSAAASTLIKMLRAADWTAYEEAHGIPAVVRSKTSTT